MDASDMGLPDSVLLKRIRTLVEEGFDFNDLLNAEAERAALMNELSGVIDKHDTGPFKGVRLAPLSVEAEDIPEFIDCLEQSNPETAASLAIRLTNVVRGSSSYEARQRLKEFLGAIGQSELALRLMAECCMSELR